MGWGLKSPTSSWFFQVKYFIEWNSKNSKKNLLKYRIASRYNQDASIQNPDYEKSNVGLVRPCLNGK